VASAYVEIQRWKYVNLITLILTRTRLTYGYNTGGLSRKYVMDSTRSVIENTSRWSKTISMYQ